MMTDALTDSAALCQRSEKRSLDRLSIYNLWFYCATRKLSSIAILAVIFHSYQASAVVLKRVSYAAKRRD